MGNRSAVSDVPDGRQARAGQRDFSVTAFSSAQDAGTALPAGSPKQTAVPRGTRSPSSRAGGQSLLFRQPPNASTAVGLRVGDTLSPSGATVGSTLSDARQFIPSGSPRPDNEPSSREQGSTRVTGVGSSPQSSSSRTAKSGQDITGTVSQRPAAFPSNLTSPFHSGAFTAVTYERGSQRPAAPVPQQQNRAGMALATPPALPPPTERGLGATAVSTHRSFADSTSVAAEWEGSVRTDSPYH